MIIIIIIIIIFYYFNNKEWIYIISYKINKKT